MVPDDAAPPIHPSESSGGQSLAMADYPCYTKAHTVRSMFPIIPSAPTSVQLQIKNLWTSLPETTTIRTSTSEAESKKWLHTGSQTSLWGRMDERQMAAAPASAEPTSDHMATNVVSQSPSREQVTGAEFGLAPGLRSGPSVEKPTPSAPATAAAQPHPAAATAPNRATAPGSPGQHTDYDQHAPRIPQFVAPSSYLRFKTSPASAMASASEPKPTRASLSPLDNEQFQGLVRLVNPCGHLSQRPYQRCTMRLTPCCRKRFAISSRFALATTFCRSPFD